MPDQPPALFVGVGANGVRVTSTNGIDWANPQVGKDGETYRAAAFGNGHYVAVGTFGGENIFASSEDGVKWTTSKKNHGNSVRGMGFGNGGFLPVGGDPGGVGDSHPFVLMSTDGVTWSDLIPIAGKHIIRRIAWGNDRFVGVGDRGRRATSKDGKEWTDAPDPKALNTMMDVAFGKGVFVGVGLNGLRMTTEDGLKWGNRLLGEEGEHLNSVIWAKDRFVAVSIGATYSSPDGINWKREENKKAPLIAAYGNGVFVGAAWRGRILHSPDAVEWKEVYKSDYHIEAFTYGGA
jgi:hypothetical protein